jgi:hypothetical protein
VPALVVLALAVASQAPPSTYSVVVVDAPLCGRMHGGACADPAAFAALLSDVENAAGQGFVCTSCIEATVESACTTTW